MRTPTAQDLNGRLLAAGPRRRGRTIPPDLRKQIVEYCQRALREGQSYAAVAAELDLSVQTLRNWAPRPTFIPVSVTPAPAPERIVVCGPHGLRIEGLTIAHVAELLRSLA